ncbi:ArsR/SmtB family transcription factor [Actinoplanes sp. NPDC020271]|uniref:ArsR/SmtB family transcription factor n=1 Tax=Actinoplanes sp. NPDC020271 TaxID=3363896 RepID=UPI0037BBE08E
MAARIVEDVETLKALADPARLSMLELMMTGHARSWTAKELATAIGMPVKKIYYHLALLEQRGLLEVRATQVVNGIIEKHYGASQKSITFQRGNGSPGVPAAGAEEVGRLVTTLFDQVEGTIMDGLRAGRVVMDRAAPDDRRVVVSYSTARMSPAQAGRFRDALLGVVAEFDAMAAPGMPTFELLVAFSPVDGHAGEDPVDGHAGEDPVDGHAT